MPKIRRAHLAAALAAALALTGLQLVATPTAQAAELPGAPTGITTKSSRGLVELTFAPGAANGGDQLVTQLLRGPSADSLSQVDETVATSFRQTGLTPGATYFYALRTSSTAGASEATTPISVTVPTEALVYAAADDVDGDLFVVATTNRVPSGEPIALTDGNTAYVIDSAVSPNGKWIAYSVEGLDGTTAVRLMAIDGTQQRTVRSTGTNYADALAWSGDGKDLAYTYYDQNDDGFIKVVKSVHTSSAVTDLGDGYYPSWMKDGKYVVANAAFDDGLVKIEVATGKQTLIPSTGGLWDAAVSPDGTKIAAVASVFDDTSVFPTDRLIVQTIGSSTRKFLTPNASVWLGSPRWSLDSTQIVYRSLVVTDTSFGNASLRRANVDGSGSVELVSDVAADIYAGSFADRDTIKPVASMTVPATSLATSTTVKWSGSDIGTGVASYNVRYRSITPNGNSYPKTLKTATASTWSTVPISPGNRYCFQAQAIDASGNVGNWSSEQCLSAPIDDRTFKRSSFTTVSGSYYYQGGSATAAKAGASLTLANVKAKQVGVVVRSTSTGGSVTAYLGSTKLGTVSTKGGSAYKKTIWLPATSLKTGTLKLVTTSSSRVYIDGVVIK